MPLIITNNKATDSEGAIVRLRGISDGFVSGNEGIRHKGDIVDAAVEPDFAFTRDELKAAFEALKAANPEKLQLPDAEKVLRTSGIARFAQGGVEVGKAVLWIFDHWRELKDAFGSDS